MNYWKGDRAHLEFATGADVPVEARDGGRSWFGVSEVVAVPEGEPAPQDEPAEFLTPLFDAAANRLIETTEQLAECYTRSLRACIDAWRDGEMTDCQASYLSYFVRHDLLPNSLGELPGVAPLVREYRRLEAEIPVPTRAAGAA